MIRSLRLLVPNALLITIALAQSNASGATGLVSSTSIKTSPTSSRTSDAAASRSSAATTTDVASPAETLLPASSTSASDSNSNPPDTGGLVNYYFVFLALILCVAALGALMLYRRKKRIRMGLQTSRQNALAQDLHAWDPARGRRRHWQGRWRSAQLSREEGLNEEGEAPPPYIHKTQEDAALQTNQNMPAIPLQTLSREQVGLKPPEYSETVVRSVSEPSSSSSASSPPESHPLGPER